MSSKIETEYGNFDFHLFKSVLDDRQHIALSMGALNTEPTLVRVHSEYRLSDIFKQVGTPGHKNLSRALEKFPRLNTEFLSILNKSMAE